MAHMRMGLGSLVAWALLGLTAGLLGCPPAVDSDGGVNDANLEPGSGSVPGPAANAEEAGQRAREATAGFMQELFAELNSHVEAGTPVDAVTVCGDAEVRIGGDVETTFGLAIGRTALRTRNPDNAPDDFERGILEQWAAVPTADLAPVAEVVDAPGGGRELRFMKPIVLQPMCETCHGAADTIRDDIATALRDRYVDDEATGYAAGELRGAVTVRVPIGADD